MFNKHFKFSNNALLQHINRNVVHPTVSLNSSEQREVSTNVEIVELNNSSDECEDRNNVDNAWSYINHDVYTDEDSYRTNKSARERRRLNREANDGDLTNGTTDVNNETSPDQIYPSFYSLDRDYSNDHEFISYHNRNVNCFTIPNKFGTPSTSSDDQNGDIQIIHCGDVTPNRDYWNNSQESFSNEIYLSQDFQTDKRSIWIYSFKNKHSLSENDYVLTNIPSKDSSSCNSSTDELDNEATKESDHYGRIATPIPYIPRLNLNLTLTLPTVTEVTEPVKQTSSTVAKINNTELVDSSQSAPKHKENVPSGSSKSKIVNRTSLSPRLIFKNTNKVNGNPIEEKDQIYYESEIRVISNRENKIDYQTEQLSIKRKSDNEDNDYKGIELCLQKAHIKLTPKPLDKDRKIISEPSEKLKGNWIDGKESYNELTIIYDYDLPIENLEQNSSPTNRDKGEEENNAFIRNMPLLKTPESNESKPIAESPPSLDLSIITDVDTTKESWFKKLFRCIKCFKKDK